MPIITSIPTAPDLGALTLADAVWAMLDAITGVNAFDGEVTNPPLDEDGRVHAYAVFYPGPGHARSMLLCQTLDTLDWTFQITCAGGDRTRALWCVQKVREVFTGARIDNGDGDLVVIGEAGDPGPVRRDDDVSPPRFYVPLDFTVTA